ncbi:MAG: hypothetical protein IJI46_00780 [Erysipelotrichaceae bacterium]|nr:hypothetical protein [Erysipelotrichaceae bacterium]
MARLTRTQKFAELRDSLANDKESSLKTADLSSYEDRLSSITDLLSPLQKKEPEVIETPIVQSVEEDPKYTWTEFEETPIEQLVESFKNDDLDERISQIEKETSVHDEINQSWIKKETAPVSEPVEEISIASDTNVKPLIEEPVYEPLVEDAPIINIVDEDYTPIIDESQYVAPLIDDVKVDETPVYSAPLIDDSTPAVQPQETPVIKPVEEKKPESEFLGYYNPSPEIENLYKEAELKAKEEAEAVEVKEESEPVAQVEETPIAIEVVEEEPVEVPEEVEVNEEVVTPIEEDVDNIVKEAVETAELVDNHAVDHLNDLVNSYISETINEVGEYNKQNGDMTISQLTSNMVHEIRHPGEPLEEIEVPVVEEEEPVESDEEFSNTVSMEISKIMEEITAADETSVEEEIPEVLEAPEETIVVEEHPVLAKVLEEEPEDVVEIKNITELEAEPTRDTVSNTIPFVVATSDDEEEIEDDDEEGSNTILNIILIVLIIVLVAVLGLIVFYILKTKGVI